MSTPEQAAREDIEKGLARLNAAWQSLKKVKEEHQRAEELYEAFYDWLQTRASFSLDTTTNFYRLDTNETSICESKTESCPLTGSCKFFSSI